MVRLQGQRAESQEHMRLGSLPKLQLYDIRDLLDLTPALLRDILSLRALRVQASHGHLLLLHRTHCWRCDTNP